MQLTYPVASASDGWLASWCTPACVRRYVTAMATVLAGVPFSSDADEW